jgi:hypothetical protein
MMDKKRYLKVVLSLLKAELGMVTFVQMVHCRVWQTGSEDE